ncbi:hypothetical protein NB714_004714 [Pantoea dispersa]|nr:hypothetical protein [Pantoea dispersa]MCW0328589.1 hypothetical protein [Pantoea dispersa]MCW0435016.1 hypothetical protein [Pantoea dispersa]
MLHCAGPDGPPETGPLAGGVPWPDDGVCAGGFSAWLCSLSSAVPICSSLRLSASFCALTVADSVDRSFSSVAVLFCCCASTDSDTAPVKRLFTSPVPVRSAAFAGGGFLSAARCCEYAQMPPPSASMTPPATPAIIHWRRRVAVLMLLMTRPPRQWRKSPTRSLRRSRKACERTASPRARPSARTAFR